MLQRDATADEHLVDRLQKAAFDYIARYTNPANGLVADHSLPTSPCSIAATGFGLSSYPVAVERGWIERREAIARTLAALRFFTNSEQGGKRDGTGHKGLYYHFLDMQTGKRVWRSELSTIDTALLIAGMLTAAAYFDGDHPEEREIRDLATELHARVNWHWALNRGETLTMGWRPSCRFIKWRWQGYSEAIILYVLALASPRHAIPESSYRAFTSAYQWLSEDGEPYLYAGPLFIHLFSHIWIDFRGIHDGPMAQHRSDYFRNTQLAIESQRHYAAKNPHSFLGYSADVWGLTAHGGPTGTRRMRDGRRQAFLAYTARGAPFGPDDGTLAPWAALACLPFAPEAAMDGVKAVLAAYPALLTADRFPGSFNPSLPGTGPEGWVEDREVGIDQGLLVTMIENRRSGLVWNLMRRSPVIRLGLERAGFGGGWLSSL
ncbi:glucoamylase family protein [Pararhizobium sp.]|uniref:glucoamylase family protein n=1 Tax=Pararhizobium sp. TaxID=1977563 RepID=UPI0027224DE1|nr:glucoamylase family protein [Pararhizobium sp.]MDO9414680.1 glucoamylase family protein [Pararhizobium sp.]